MKACECQVQDIITYEAERCVVRAKSDGVVSVFNLKTRELMGIPSLTYVVMVERPRKHYPKGHEFRVYKIRYDKTDCKRIIARGLTYLEAEEIRDKQPKSTEFYFLVVNGKIKHNQW